MNMDAFRPRMYESPPTDSPGGDIDPQTAQTLIGKLRPGAQDMLGLDTLGISIKDIAEYFSVVPPTVSRNLSRTIYPTLGIEIGASGKISPENRLRAREIVWSSGLLQKVVMPGEDKKTLPITRAVIRENGLGIEHFNFMAKFNLTMRELAVLQLSKELTSSGVARVLSSNPRNIDYLRSNLWKRLRVENRREFIEQAFDLGSFALSTIDSSEFGWDKNS